MTDEFDTTTVEGLMKYVERVSREQYAGCEPDYAMPPTWFAACPSGNMVICTPWASDAEKDAAIKFLSVMFAVKEVTHYVMACEAWVARYDDKNPEINGVAPSQRADRWEVLNIIGVDKSGTRLGRDLTISRGEDGAPVLGESTTMKGEVGGRMGGRIIGLLDMPPIPDHLREKFAKMIAEAEAVAMASMVPSGTFH